VGGACWFVGGDNQSCATVCATNGLAYDSATASYAGSGGSAANCQAVLDALSASGGSVLDIACADGWGCLVNIASRFRCTIPATNSTAALLNVSRACACQ